MARVLAVLNLIQSRGRWNAKAIGEELECSERTVYRDLEVLEFAGVPWYFDEQNQCYRVRPDYRFPSLGLTEDELLGQAIATKITKARGLDVGQGASALTRKLAAVSTEQTQQLLADAMAVVSVLDLKLADHSRHNDAIKTAQLALIRSKQLVGTYESPYEASPVRLKLHPYRLCLIKSAWYIIGRTAENDQPRTYRIARFKTLRMLEDRAVVPSDFNLQSYFGKAWGVFRGDRTYSVEIWFAPEAANVVTETIWHATQQVTRHKDGSLVLNFEIDGLEEIANWVLSWTGRCKVLEPPELRQLIVQKLQAGLAMHESERLESS
jgi:predicted DNA-binding transcriptional regulator YafY